MAVHDHPARIGHAYTLPVVREALFRTVTPSQRDLVAPRSTGPASGPPLSNA